MKKSQKIFLITSAITGVIIVFVTCAIAIFNVDEKIQTLASIGGTQTKELLADGDNTEELINNQLLEVALMQLGFGYFRLPGNETYEYSEEEIRNLYALVKGIEVELEVGELKEKIENVGVGAHIDYNYIFTYNYGGSVVKKEIVIKGKGGKPPSPHWIETDERYKKFKKTYDERKEKWDKFKKGLDSWARTEKVEDISSPNIQMEIKMIILYFG